MPKIRFECENCGKEVEKYDTQASKFCSLECYWEDKAKNKFEKVCPVCGERFVGTVNQIYCSQVCKRKRDKEHEKGDYIVVCPECGEERSVQMPIYGARQEKPLCKSCSILIARRQSPVPKGESSYAWKGGRRIDSYGYIKLYQPGHPHADSTNYVREHIYVVCEAYGVDYFQNNGGTVHHINGDKQDNRIENLHVCSSEQNREYTRSLLSIAYELVKQGIIEFVDGEYRCPLLGDE